MALQDKIGRAEIVDKICGLVGSLKKDKNFCLAITARGEAENLLFWD